MKRRPPLVPPVGIAALVAVLALFAAVSAAGRGLGETLDFRELRYDSLIRYAAQRHLPRDLDWLLFKSLVRQESGFDARARSRRGAVGLCQLMPATARELGLARGEWYHPRHNLEAGARYLAWCWEYWAQVPDPEERLRLALASYNAGPTRVRQAVGRAGDTRWEAVQPHLPGETQRYVTMVRDHFYPLYREAAGPITGGGRPATWRDHREAPTLWRPALLDSDSWAS